MAFGDQRDKVDRLMDQLAIQKRDLDYQLEVLGMKRFWDKDKEDNVDATHPMQMAVYIPPETKVIQRSYLRLRLLNFRSYGGTAQSTVSVTSTPNGSIIKNTDDTTAGSWDLGGAYSVPDVMELKGAHGHGIPNGTVLVVDGGGTVTFSTEISHAHGIVPHDHQFSLLNHTHDIPGHVHDIVHGIYEGTSATGVTVLINGIDRTTALGGPFSADQDQLDITQYLTATGFNTVEFGATTLGRIHATLVMEIYLS